MTDQQFVMDLEAGQRAIVEPDDEAWLRDRLQREPGPTRLSLRYGDDDTEGHARTLAVRVIAEDADDTEGHAISIHFPSATEADAFRKRLLVTGVLAGTVALGAAGGVGLANLGSNQSAGVGAAQGAVTGSAWTQDERPAAAAASVSTGSAWTQDERPGAAGAASEGLSPADRAYADRLSGQAGGGVENDDQETPKGSGLTPR